MPSVAVMLVVGVGVSVVVGLSVVVGVGPLVRMGVLDPAVTVPLAFNQLVAQDPVGHPNQATHERRVRPVDEARVAIVERVDQPRSRNQ